MAGMEPDRILSEDLDAAKGLIKTKIHHASGRVEASALFGLIRAEAVQNGERGCSPRINVRPSPGCRFKPINVQQIQIQSQATGPGP